MTTSEVDAGRVVVEPREGFSGRSLLDVRGHALDLATAHHREVYRDALSDDERRAQVTADAAAYERYELTGEVYRPQRAVPLAALVALLREMDLQQGRTDQRGGAEIAWYYWRNDVEDLLGLERGALYAGNPDASYPEEGEDPAGAAPSGGEPA